jgi:hypothetical protein
MSTESLDSSLSQAYTYLMHFTKRTSALILTTSITKVEGSLVSR